MLIPFPYSRLALAVKAALPKWLNRRLHSINVLKTDPNQ
jgi:hypothetical protein